MVVWLQAESGEQIACLKETRSALFERICDGDEPICPWMMLRNSTYQSHPTAAAAADDDDDEEDRPADVIRTCCPLQGCYTIALVIIVHRLFLYVSCKNAFCRF